MSVVLQLQLFTKCIVESKIGTLYPRVSNKSALSMVSNLLQNNALELNCNLRDQIQMFIINGHLVFQFVRLDYRSYITVKKELSGNERSEWTT